MKLVEHAHNYANHFAWSVVSVRGSDPAVRLKAAQHRAPNHHTRNSHFRREGVDGVAVLLGRVSAGLTARTFDGKEAYFRWVASSPDLASTLPCIRTGLEYTVLFRLPIHIEGGHIDLRGGVLRDVGLMLLPPSGGTVEWAVHPREHIPLLSEADLRSSGLLVRPPLAAGQAPSVPPLIVDAIRRSQPTGPTDREHKEALFKFARLFKFDESVSHKGPDVRSYLKAWHETMLPYLGDKEWASTEKYFQFSWTKANTPLSDAQFMQVVERAEQMPDPDWLSELYLPDAAYPLARICLCLQEHWGDQPFFLSVRGAARALRDRVGYPYAGDLLHALVNAGLLVEVEKGSKSTRLATTFHFVRPGESPPAGVVLREEPSQGIPEPVPCAPSPTRYRHHSIAARGRNIISSLRSLDRGTTPTSASRVTSGPSRAD